MQCDHVHSALLASPFRSLGLLLVLVLDDPTVVLVIGFMYVSFSLLLLNSTLFLNLISSLSQLM